MEKGLYCFILTQFPSRFLAQRCSRRFEVTQQCEFGQHCGRFLNCFKKPTTCCRNELLRYKIALCATAHDFDFEHNVALETGAKNRLMQHRLK